MLVRLHVGSHYVKTSLETCRTVISDIEKMCHLHRICDKSASVICAHQRCGFCVSDDPHLRGV